MFPSNYVNCKLRMFCLLRYQCYDIDRKHKLNKNKANSIRLNLF